MFEEGAMSMSVKEFHTYAVHILERVEDFNGNLHKVCLQPLIRCSTSPIPAIWNGIQVRGWCGKQTKELAMLSSGRRFSLKTSLT